MVRREQWSMTTPTHQQKGHTWGSAKGTQDVQKPSDVGTVVRSTCQRSFGPRAVMRRGVAFRAGWGAGDREDRNIRRTVVGPRCRPARARTRAILTLPMAGQRTFSRLTTYPTNSGNLLTGSG